MFIKNIINQSPNFTKYYKVLRSYMWRMESNYYKKKSENQRRNLVSKDYKKWLRQELNWDNLRTYNEKMQWAKLHTNTSIKTKLADKYLVRSWVKEVIGEQYLIPLLGVWENFEEIDFSKLPNKFVLKTNHASGTNIIVTDKSQLDKKVANITMTNWLKVNYAYFSGFQMQYENIEPKIIAEKFIQDKNGELNDYRFMCFNGKVYYCIVDIPQKKGKKRRNIYDLNWKLQYWQQGEFENYNDHIPRPINLDLMISLAEKLSKEFKHARVDLYDVDGKIYFGEMTFTNASGLQKIKPHSVNLYLGKLWELPYETKSIE